MAANKTNNTPLSETVPSVPFSETIDSNMRDVVEAAAPIDKVSPQASTRNSQNLGRLVCSHTLKGALEKRVSGANMAEKLQTGLLERP